MCHGGKGIKQIITLTWFSINAISILNLLICEQTSEIGALIRDCREYDKVNVILNYDIIFKEYYCFEKITFSKHRYSPGVQPDKHSPLNFYILYLHRNS